MSLCHTDLVCRSTCFAITGRNLKLVPFIPDGSWGGSWWVVDNCHVERSSSDWAHVSAHVRPILRAWEDVRWYIPSSLVTKTPDKIVFGCIFSSFLESNYSIGVRW